MGCAVYGRRGLLVIAWFAATSAAPAPAPDTAGRRHCGRLACWLYPFPYPMQALASQPEMHTHTHTRLGGLHTPVSHKLSCLSSRPPGTRLRSGRTARCCTWNCPSAAAAWPTSRGTPSGCCPPTRPTWWRGCASDSTCRRTRCVCSGLEHAHARCGTCMCALCYLSFSLHMVHLTPLCCALMCHRTRWAPCEHTHVYRTCKPALCYH